MTITGTYSQTVSFVWAYASTSSRDTGGLKASTSTSPSTTASPTTDRVDLSPEAIAASSTSAGGTETQPGAAEVPVDVAAPPQEAIPAPSSDPAPAAHGGSSRADALFAALDADHDGAVTKQEFTDGAAALLRQARGHGHHHRAHGADDEEQGRGGHVPPGLEKRVERAFAAIDANHDGAVDPGELNAGFTRPVPHGADNPVTPPSAEDQSAEQPTPTASPSTRLVAFSVTQVTTISFAIQRYAAADQPGGAAAPGTLDAVA